ncbi:hypothetical protein Ancab_001432 [Ancistrocladus abbreviatus]
MLECNIVEAKVRLEWLVDLWDAFVGTTLKKTQLDASHSWLRNGSSSHGGDGTVQRLQLLRLAGGDERDVEDRFGDRIVPKPNNVI